MHQVLGFDKDGDDFAVMRDIVEGKGAVLAVLEPFLRGLVATDEEVPGSLRHLTEILPGVDPDASSSRAVVRMTHIIA